MWVKQRYRDISPVTLQVVGGAVNSSLYCGEVEGVSGGAGLVESFLVELYRCKLCQFTCGLKAAISSHLLLRHRPPTLTYLGRGDRAGGAETGLQLDLNGEPKQSDEDEDFLLYNMLDDISPPTCDISGEGGLQVAHTCEVSTLFEEDEEEVDSSVCPSDPPSSQEEMAQSAHLMTLGLCRISSVRAPPPPPSSSAHPQDCGASIRMKASPLGLPCPLCPLTLPSRRLLDVHVRSHRAAGGFGCVRCRQTADSWEELEPHWRRHCSRRRKKRGREQEQKKKTVAVCRRTLRKGTMKTERWNNHLIGCTEGKEVELPDSLTSRLQTGSQQNVTKNTKNRKKKNTSGKETTGFTCSLCHRKFSSKLTLRRHLGVHGGEKPFTCPHCTYSSRLKASLLQHLRTHTGEKPYRCAECPYASIDRSSLLRHSRTHSQVKPYRCKLCDYSSIQKRSLDLHARRHHTGEMFTCQRCEYSSPDRQLLLRHVRRHHAHSQDATL